MIIYIKNLIKSKIKEIGFSKKTLIKMGCKRAIDNYTEDFSI